MIRPTSPPRIRPPALARLLLCCAAPERDRTAMLSDLDEEYAVHVVPASGRWRARRWYWLQALGSLPPNLARRWWRRTSPNRGRRGVAPPSPRGNPLDTLLQDFHYAARGLLSRPGFALVALTTLALGIGANAAIFSVVHGVVLRPLPYEDPDRLVRFAPDQLFSNDVREAAALQAGIADTLRLAAYGRSMATLTGSVDAEVVRGASVSDNHFEVLGARPLLGRTFLPGEGEPGRARVIVLTHGLWQRRYGGDPAIVGESIEISGVPYEVIGVMGPQHQPMENDWSYWLPLYLDPESQSGNALAIIGRLVPGATAQQATDRFRQVLRTFWEAGGTEVEPSMLEPLRAAPISNWILGGVRGRLLMLMGAVAFVLLIACANVANLFLARGSARTREIAVRSALGAGRGRLVRLLMAESALLGVLGGLAGVALAASALRVGLASLPADVPRAANIGLDPRVLGFAVVLSLASAFAFGLVPAYRSVALGYTEGLKEGGRGSSTGATQMRLNNLLVAAEVALAVVLVVGAGLTLRSFWRLTSVDPGFSTEGVVALRPIPDASRYPTPQDYGPYHDDVKAAIERLPETIATGGIMFLPMTPGGFWGGFNPDSLPPEGANLPAASGRLVFPGYFASMQIPMLRGRDFDGTDNADSEIVTVINEALAAAAWPGEDPIGRRLFTLGELRRVVGVVGDVRQNDLQTASQPEAYFPYSQRPFRAMYFTVRVRGDAAELTAAVQAAARSVDSEVPIVAVAAMDDVVAATVSSNRFFTGLVAAFGILALTLGAIGVYGVTAYVVAQRTHEMGIRVALGANAGAVVRQTMMRGLAPVGVGVIVGLAGARVAGGLMGARLYGVGVGDPLTYVAVPALLLLAAVVALYGPARRASRVDPIEVLRSD